MKALAKALKNRIIDKVSDVISGPARTGAELSKRKADYEVGVITDRRDLMKKKGVINRHPHGKKIEAEYQRIKREHGY